MGAGQAPVSDAIQGPVGDGGLGTVDTRGQTGMTRGGGPHDERRELERNERVRRTLLTLEKQTN